jgi:PHP domain
LNLRNSDIGELLARAAEHAKQSLQRASRRASRRVILWPEEAEDILNGGWSLTELPGIGPYLDRQIVNWLEHPPDLDEVIPEIRRNFLTFAEARRIRSREPDRFAGIRGDLQMHTAWSDGSGSIEDMANAAAALGYSYLAITDHSKGLKIAGGINEEQLGQQAEEIETVNDRMPDMRVLRSIELNLSPTGSGDMDQPALGKLDLVLGCFHSELRKKDDQTQRYLKALRNPSIHILGHPHGRIYNSRLA